MSSMTTSGDTQHDFLMSLQADTSTQYQQQVPEQQDCCCNSDLLTELFWA